MVVSSLIHWVEQFLLVGLVSLAIVIAIIRAYITMFLAALRESGLYPLFIICLFGILSVTIIKYCACRNASDDEEYGMVEDLDVVEGRMLVIKLTKA